MKDTYDTAMDKVYADEGGFSQDAHDPGGATKYGITIADYREFKGRPVTVSEVRDMPKSDAAAIYRKKYANGVQYDSWPAGWDYSVLDAAINSGIGRAKPWAVRVMGVNAATFTWELLARNAAARPSVAADIKSYWSIRLSFLHALKNWRYFGTGWGRRVATGEALALRLWSQYGLQKAPVEVKKDLAKHADEAAAKSQKGAGGAVVVGSGGASTQHPSTDVLLVSDHHVLKYVLAAVAVAAVVGLVFYAWKHYTRAQALQGAAA